MLSLLNVSNNNLIGKIPNLELNLTYGPTIDLSSNQLEGSIPPFLSQASSLFLSNNKFSDLVSFGCSNTEIGYLQILDLSNNRLKGELPDCWNNLTLLEFVDLSNNKLKGKIPSSMGALTRIEALSLRNNSLNGQLPSSLRNCSNKLVWLDLGENKFYGSIPLWIGESLQLRLISLRFNNFYGSIPPNLCYLRELHVLDLSLNNLSGRIPHCVSNFTSMAKDTMSPRDNWFDEIYFYTTWYGVKSMNPLLFLMWKGVDHYFKNEVVLLKSIDLSSNNLTGEIPTEIENLFGLVSLNLSRNNLSGEIIPKIGNLKSLEFLDLSRNNLSGIIPSSLALIDRLSMLDLSNNHLYGKIPIGTQLQGFNASCFEGNSNLCGKPLDRKCPGEEDPTEHQNPPILHAEDASSVFLEALYMSMGIGFFTAFCGFIGSILLIPSWRETYSRFLNTLILRIFKCWER